MAETIYQIGNNAETDFAHSQPDNNQTSKYSGLTQEQIILVKNSDSECDNKVVIARFSNGDEAAERLQSTCDEQEAGQISRFLSFTPEETYLL
jgi:hypothetical protein